MLFALASSLLFSFCGESQSAPTEASITSKETASSVVEVKTPAAERQDKGVFKPSGFTVTCEEKEEKNPESEDPIIIKTCTYGNYRTISTGTPDFNGRYSYENGLYRFEKGKYIEISNSALFNQKQEKLLKHINQQIKADYLKLSSDPESKECFEGAEPFHDFPMDELRLEFEAGQLVFHVEFGLPTACLSVNGTSVSFTLQEVEPYLNK
ncbi:hypothetical protein [Rufibacter roseus]|uniref:DUF3298 domain-containing protein n=1 Tax=Rufibacter roseus TaxID=1567108 RepID=A0ABW2DP30_9BACT|nr:hypothetical protein [Rufibacter roseus]